MRAPVARVRVTVGRHARAGFEVLRDVRAQWIANILRERRPVEAIGRAAFLRRPPEPGAAHVLHERGLQPVAGDALE